MKWASPKGADIKASGRVDTFIEAFMFSYVKLRKPVFHGYNGSSTLKFPGCQRTRARLFVLIGGRALRSTIQLLIGNHLSLLSGGSKVILTTKKRKEKRYEEVDRDRLIGVWVVWF